MAPQFCECMNHHWIIPFTGMNCLVCELYLNKAVEKANVNDRQQCGVTGDFRRCWNLPLQNFVELAICTQMNLHTQWPPVPLPGLDSTETPHLSTRICPQQNDDNSPHQAATRVSMNSTVNEFAVAIQLLNCVWLFVTPWTVARQASLSITNSQSLLKLMSIESMMPSNHLILCHPLLLLPSIFPSIRVFSNESALRIRWPKYWSFSISPFNEYSGLISCRIDWLDLLAVQGTLKVLLQHHNLKALILRCSAICMVQLPHLFTTTGKAIALTIQTFTGKVMSLLFNMLSRFVTVFLPRSFQGFF